MQGLVSKYEFVEPNVKIELEGELGLSLHEIAKSLQTQYYNVKKKIDRMIKDDRLKIVIPYGIPNNSNGLRTESYILPVSEAKFFVAKYDNEVGDAYTRFLIKCEEALLNKMRERGTVQTKSTLFASY